ncbi:MAG: AAA family ATPase, partial [Actinobacteria bacterium]|nr:AAA family ATPase [Actinomycetota bacterium]
MVSCPACGAANPDRQRFCGECGARLTDTATLREERKVVTLLFADLAGFTGRAEQLDPEDVRAMLSRYYATLRLEIERYGGVVEKFIGDAVMAVFGAPVAHEDDPERAVRAALAIRNAIAALNDEEGLALAIRVGVNTGEALVALGARANEGEGMVSGDVVNTAARLESAAPVGGILVGEVTYRATQRLVTELFGIVEASPEIYWWRQGRSLPYGETQTFRALAEIVKAQAGILESDSAEAAHTKLTRAVANALPSPHDRDWVEPLLAPLIGVGAAGSAINRGLEAFAAWRRFLEGLAEQRPLVLVFEDLHWADDGLLDFVDHLAEWVTTVPMLIVSTARPELLERRPEWGGGKRNATTTSLAPLTEVEASLQLARLLGQALLPADVQASVLERSSGNPLYTEEYVRMLQDRGFLVEEGGSWQLTNDENLPLPENVQGMIAARLDALTVREKELIQDAAVVGKVFWTSALAALGRPGIDDELTLHALTRKEFIRRDRDSAVANDTQYAFLHVLVRDVAYAQIPRPTRATKHRAAADWLDTLASDRASDRSEMLTHHLSAASELAEVTGQDVGELRPRLRAALIASSERAEALFSWPAARDRAREALARSDGDVSQDTVSALALRVAWASFCVGDYDTDAAARARDSSLAAGDVG